MHCLKTFAAAAIALLVASSALPAAEWQWAIDVAGVLARPAERPRAFLWIPPNCTRVRGVVFGQHNMQEEPILEHPAFRATLAELGFAEVWVAPGFDAYFRFDQGAGERFDTMMNGLADASGYSELATAPVVPIGHSAAAMLPEYFAAWKPERTLAYLSVSGQWPYVPAKEAPHVDGRSLDGVPGLVTIGEYEWADQRAADGLKIFADHPKSPFSFLACPADGHFEATDEKVAFLCFYLKKVAHYRLSAIDGTGDAVPTLKPIDPTTTGWLTERWHMGKDPATPAAPVGRYAGDVTQAFWCFDEETAKAIEAFQARHRGKTALLGYVQDGQTLPQNPKLHQQVNIPFKPTADGVTIKFGTAFLDTVPGGRPTRWTGLPEGSHIDPPASVGKPMEIVRITGPIKKLADDTFALDLNRTSYVGDRRGNEAWFYAVWPGDDTHKRMIQQSRLAVPAHNTQGTPQKITFAKPGDMTVGQSPVALSAASDANLPVRFFVESGPAEIDGNMLKLLPIPPRAKFPVAVTVVAWQFGRAAEPAVQDAAPVTQTFAIRAEK